MTATPPPGPPPGPPFGPPPGLPPGGPGGPYPYYAGPPMPPNPQQERTLASAAHWGALVANLISGLGFLVPLILMVSKGNESPFVRRHAVESLNFQLSVLIYLIAGSFIGMLVALVTFGVGLILLLPLALAVFICAIIFTITGSMRASQGQDYRYPMTMRMVR